MAAVTTTTLANGVPSKWTDFDLACNEEMMFANKISEEEPTQFGTLYVPYIAAIAASTLAAGSGSSLTFTANTEGRATLTPATRYGAVELERQAEKRAVANPTKSYKQQLAAGLSAQIDADCAQDVSSLVSSIVNAAAGLTRADVTEAIGRGFVNAKNMWKPGQIIGIIHGSQVNNFLNQDALVSAQYRGDQKDNAVNTGWVVNAFGVRWYESGNIYVSGGNAYNVMFIKDAFSIAYNWRPMADVQPYQLTQRLIYSADFAHAAKRENYAVQMISPNS